MIDRSDAGRIARATDGAATRWAFSRADIRGPIINGWLIAVDREMSGGFVSIQDLYAVRFSDSEIAIEAVHALLAYGSQIRPTVLVELSEPIFHGLRVPHNSAARLIKE